MPLLEAAPEVENENFRDIAARVSEADGTEAVSVSEETTSGSSENSGQEPIDTPVEPVAESASQNYLLDLLKERGISLDAQSDDDALERLIAGHQTSQQQSQHIAQLQQLAQLGYHAQTDWQQYQAWKANQGQQAQPQAPAMVPAEEAKAKAPKYDPQWEKLLTRDAQGNIVPVNQWVSPGAVQAYMEWEQHDKDLRRRMVEDPYSVLKESGAVDQLRQEVMAEVQAQQQAAQQQFAVQQNHQLGTEILYQNTPWLAEHQNGQPVRDAFGKLVPSADGRVYVNAVLQLEALGVRGAQQIHQLALQSVLATKYQQQAAAQNSAPAAGAQAVAATPAQQTKANFLQRVAQRGAGRAPNRNGSVQAAERNGEAQNPEVTFKSMLRAAFGENGN